MVTSPRASRFVLAGACVAVFTLLVGALGSRFGVWTFFVGFYFLFAGILVALICAVWGVAALVFLRGQVRAKGLSLIHISEPTRPERSAGDGVWGDKK